MGVCFVGGNAAGLAEAIGRDLAEATGRDLAVGESGRAATIVEQARFADEAAVENVLINVLITTPAGVLDRPAAEAAGG